MASNRRRAGAGAIVAAALLPPLGVALDQGITPAFWIATGLTCLAFVPGVMFALVTVLRPHTVRTA